MCMYCNGMCVRARVLLQVKCDHYWPFTDEPVMYGEISVEMLSESESPEWTIRSFRLGYVSGDESMSELSNYRQEV